jgi:hypothetical protein
MICCKCLVDGVTQTMPFQRTIATGFYDGPTDGFTECSECRTAYSFRKLDWDDLQDVRITGFGPLQTSLDTIAARLKINQADVGRLLVVPSSSESLDQFVKEAFVNPPVYVAAIAGGWPGRSTVWRDIRGLDLQSVKDWFSLLGISRGN